MLGAYVAWSAGTALGAFAGSPFGFWGAALVAALAVAALGALVEVLLLKRLYAAPELLQLTATFGVVLIVRDAALARMGTPRIASVRACRVSTAPSQWLGSAVPQYDLFLLVVGPVVLDRC